jgi:hypothetical protein
LEPESEPSRRKTSGKKKVTIEKQPKYIEVGKFLIFLFQSVNYIKFVFLTPILMFLIFLLKSVDYKILFVLFYLIPILKDSTAEQEQVRYLLELVRRINKGKKGEQNPDNMIFSPGVFDKALGFKQSPPKKPIIKKSKHEEYGVASSSKSTSKSAYKPIVISSSDENEDDEIKRQNKKKQKQHKKRKRSASRSDSEESNESDTEDDSIGPRREKYFHLTDLPKDKRDALRVSK